MLHDLRWYRTVFVLTPILFAAVLAAAFISDSANAQSPTSNRDPSFEDQFWKYLIGNNYKNWSPGPGRSAGFYQGEKPHGTYLKRYVNRTAAGNIGDLAIGSVVILENYLEDQSLKTISVMYRTTGFNPDGNDWYWIEYQPNGSVVRAATQNKPQGNIHHVGLTTPPTGMLMGKAASCIECHRSAGGNDFVFSNDRLIRSSLVTPDAPSSQPESGEGNFVADAEADVFFGSR